MRQYDIAIDKYWVKQSGYFRLAIRAALGIGIKDGKLLLFHVVSEVIVQQQDGLLLIQ